VALTIYCDELSDELLARRYLCRDGLADAGVERLPSLALAPEVLKPLLRWERHDWVVVRDATVVCTVEFSRHGYTGDNGFQRFARLFRSASLGIPTIYFTPFSRTRLNELDEGRQAPRNVAPELFQTLLRMSELYHVACLGMNWPTTRDGTAAPLTSPAAEPQVEQLCDLVRSVAASEPAASGDLVSEQFPEVITAMRAQAAIPFSGTATRGPAPPAGGDLVIAVDLGVAPQRLLRPGQGGQSSRCTRARTRTRASDHRRWRPILGGRR
jgi:hypothetical protein